MKKAEIIAAANNCGGRFYIEDGRLWFTPGGSLTPEMRDSVARHKRQITLLVRAMYDSEIQRARLEKRGRYPLYSSRLHEVVVIVKGDHDVNKAAKCYSSKLAFYTEKEIAFLFSGVREGWVADFDLGLVNYAKKLFGPKSKLWDIFGINFKNGRVMSHGSVGVS